MTKSLEKTDMVDLNLGDIWIPGKTLRHIPTILKYGDAPIDKLAKYFDLTLCGILTAGQIGMYYHGIKMFM